MPEWWTYGLEDFIPFSARTYYRLFALYNARIWPAQLVAIAAGIGLLVLQRGGDAWRGRLTAAILAAAWTWVAWAYFAWHYATINWAAQYIALAFVLQAALLLWDGVVRRRLRIGHARRARGRLALGLFVFALAVEPAIGPLLGRDWRQIELFGIAPDPTVVGTLGIVATADGAARWRLLAIPAAWCVMSGATLWVLRADDALVPPAAAALAILIAAAPSRSASMSEGS